MRTAICFRVALLTCVSATIGATQLLAADIAYDNASDLAYQDGWQNTDNGGYGFQPWKLSTQLYQGQPNANTGWGLADSAAGNPSWELYSDTGPYSATASRSFAAPLNSSHGGIDFDLAGNAIPTNSSFSVQLGNVPASGPGSFPFEIYVQPTTASPSEDYRIADFNHVIRDTGIVADGSEVHVSFNLTGTELVHVFGGAVYQVPTYTVTLSRAGDSPFSYSGLLLTPGDNSIPINAITFATNSTGVSKPLYFNNLAIVPVPAAAIAALPLLGLVAAARARRRNTNRPSL